MAPDSEMRNPRPREVNMPKDQEPGGGRAGIWTQVWPVPEPIFFPRRGWLVLMSTFLPPSPVISWPFNATCVATGWREPWVLLLAVTSHVQQGGAVALDHERAGIPPPVLGMGPNLPLPPPPLLPISFLPYIRAPDYACLSYHLKTHDFAAISKNVEL